MALSGMNFQVARLPALHFSPGAISVLGEQVCEWGQRILLITGAASFELLDQRFGILDLLQRAGVVLVARAEVSGEPSPTVVDQIVTAQRGTEIDLVVAIGGGSVLDAAKCVAGLLPTGDSVMEYLEGVGRGKVHDGRSLPLIAVPTTAGTGSEASMNGVLVDHQQGFKKSFRHPSLVPQVAIVDPDLLATSPQSLIAANGCDALSQLLESYLSTKASPFTDGLALSAIEQMGQGLIPLWESAGEDAAARSAVAYGSMVSGITLANAGLGAVHGLAGPIGGLFPIAHGVVCGTLLGEANRINIDALRSRDPSSGALKKYVIIGEKLGFCEAGMGEDAALDRVSAGLIEWVERLQIPRLGTLGVSQAGLSDILQRSDQKANPITLTEAEFSAIVSRRI